MASIGLFSALSHSEIHIEQARIRAMPPGQVNSAAFFIIHNTGKKDIRLTKVISSVSNKAEYHQHVMDKNGVMKMSRVMSIVVKAGQSFEFKPGAHHIMLMGLIQNLIPGQSSNITLTDDNNVSYHFVFPIVSIMATHKMGSKKHH